MGTGVIGGRGWRRLVAALGIQRGTMLALSSGQQQDAAGSGGGGGPSLVGGARKRARSGQTCETLL